MNTLFHWLWCVDHGGAPLLHRLAALHMQRKGRSLLRRVFGQLRGSQRMLRWPHAAGMYAIVLYI